MSILEKNKIDGIGKSKTENKITLMIADHFLEYGMVELIWSTWHEGNVRVGVC